MSQRGLGYQQLTSLAASTALTVPAGTGYALIKPATQAIRIRDDGVAPTAAVGYPLAVGQELRYDATSLSAVRIIEQAASATVDVLYFSGN